MSVTLFGVILFFHISAAIAGFLIAGVLHAAMQALARANTVSEVRFWARVVHRLDPLFPLVALLLLGFGAWLIHLSNGGFSWGDGWLLTSVIALVVVEGASGLTLAPRAKKLVHRIEELPDGPIPDDVQRLARDPLFWHMAHVASVGFLAVVFLMAAKPSGAWSVVLVIVGALLGVAISAAQLRALAPAGVASGQDRPAPEPA
jgi:uncharacterized membrane protein